MRIVQIEDQFHPDAGYLINIISKYFVLLGNPTTILTASVEKYHSQVDEFFGIDDIDRKDKVYEEKYGVKIVRVPIKGIISGRAIFDDVIFDIIKNENPDIVFIHGNDSYIGMKYLLSYKKMGFPVVYCSHMLEMASKNKLKVLFRLAYKKILTPIIVKNKIPIVRAQDDLYVNKRLGIPLDLAPYISFGSDTLVFKRDEIVRRKFRQENKISEDAFVVLYAGKLDQDKGGLLLANVLVKRFNVNRKLVFLIVGKTFGEYGEKIDETFAKSENEILRFPTQKYLDLAKFYQASDVAVFPKQCSLSFYDVQACGLPVIFEDNNVNMDRAKYNNALTFKRDDEEDFRDKITQMVNMSDADYNLMSDSCVSFIKENYDYVDIAKQYLDVMEKTIASMKR